MQLKRGFIKRVGKGWIAIVENLKKPPFRALTLSPEQIEKLWGVFGLFRSVEELCHWWKYSDTN